MTAALMMVTYNRLDLTKETVDCLLENTIYPFYFCIVDNGSTDGTIEWLENELPKLIKKNEECLGIAVKSNEENRGIAIGRNQGLVLANKLENVDWYATIDNDVWVPENWLSDAIYLLKKNRQFGSIGVNMEGRPYIAIDGGGKMLQVKSQGNLGTACMVFNRSLHKMLGYFNHKDYKLYAHEDADWGMRTRVVGLKLGYIAEMGKHFGEGENDQGEYREFKNEWHAKNLPAFHKNAREYMRKEKSYYVSFKDVG